VILEAADAQTMERVGARLAIACEPGLILFLSGELGAGKTTLARGFLRALGHVGSVKSPTYTLVEPYVLRNASVYHFDFYRLSDSEELEFMGVRDYLGGNAICLVEWPERAQGYLPPPDISAVIAYSDSGRQVRITAMSAAGVRVIARLCADESQ
jgi:tRNA threonylcarbamoyladenosine biosynthesis protein TsaE